MYYQACIFGIATFITLAIPIHSHAADISGINEQQIQQERETITEQRQTTAQPFFIRPDISSITQSSYASITDSPCFYISQVSLVLDDASFEAKFASLLDDVKYGSDSILGQCVGQQGLQHTLAKVQQRLIDLGYLTSRVVAEPQDLSTGHLRLTVIVGKVNAIWRTDTTDANINLHNAMTIKSGDLFSLRELETSLENLRRADGRSVNVDIKPSHPDTTHTDDNYGYSDLLVNKHVYQKINLNLSIDDAGSSSTGRYQGTLGLQINEPLHSNDVLNVSYLHSIDPWNNTKLAASNHNLYISYQYPFRKWLIDASYNDYGYDQTLAGLNFNPVYQGVSKSTQMTLGRQIRRTANSKLSGYGTLGHRSARNYIDGLEILVQQRKTSFYELGLDYEHHDNHAGKLQLKASFKKATAAFNAYPIPETYFSNVAVHPSIWNFQARYQMPMTVYNQRITYRSNLAAQYSMHKLSSQDRFAIGSRSSVRGFDGESMLSGEKGLTLQQELAWQMPLQSLSNQLYIGVDQGWVDGASTQYLSGRSLVGGILGIRLYDQSFALDAFIGKGLYAPKGIDKNSNVGFRATVSY